jgi:hypothetical protein
MLEGRTVGTLLIRVDAERRDGVAAAQTMAPMVRSG